MQRDQEAADAGQHVDQAEHPELPGARRLGERPFPHARRRAAGRRRFPLAAGQQGGERQQQRQAASHGQVGVAPTNPAHEQLRHRGGDGAAKAVRRLQHRDRRAAPRDEEPRDQRHEDHHADAVRAERHHHAVEHHHLPQRIGKGAEHQAERQQAAAEQHHAARPEPVRHPADQRRGRPAHHLADRVGDAGLRPAPAEFRGEGQQEHRVGVHHAGAEREGEEARPENQPSPADPVADPRRIPLFGAVRGHARSAPAVIVQSGKPFPDQDGTRAGPAQLAGEPASLAPPAAPGDKPRKPSRRGAPPP